MRACEGESECEGEGIGARVHNIYYKAVAWGESKVERAKARASARARSAAKARDELRASTQRNCMQARSSGEAEACQAHARGSKQTQTTGDERFVDRNAKTCNAASRNEHHFLRIARTPCWFSTFKACTVQLSKYLRK